MTNLTDVEKRILIEHALKVRTNAYAPYSNYQVGAAVRTKTGHIYSGCNVEVAAYPNGTCAERAAIYKAVSEGERQFDAIAVVTLNGGSPCGGCRQAMAEFGLDIIVLVANSEGQLLREMTVEELLPDAFTPGDLS